jgi:PIF1-like helicase/Helix-turn-helix domain/Helicase
MQNSEGANALFDLAAALVNNTSQHIFLTGKAGTGKTTFLKYIKEHTHKSAVVVAPTGVAAINAGGVTMHSFFHLPIGPFIPGNRKGFGDSNAADRHSLFKNIRFSSDKRELLQELELLIIDEVSMVRADMLDAMDVILRAFRRQPMRPFGGVQVLYIGDLFQLPPVMPDHDWEILKDFYEGPFFFHSKVAAEAPPLYIELKTIYRQSDPLFIDVLNHVRNNTVQREDLDILNSRYQPHFNPAVSEQYITLTTHNRKADAINFARLQQLPGKTHSFMGVITGDFSEKALPTDMELQLKEKAQVMFIKNDVAGKRYFNGKIATIKSISGDSITVSFDDQAEDLVLEKETWRNIRYTYHKDTDRIEEEELGSFVQYPIRLAWAVTIHKSQGLTFERAIIDAGSSFAAGQVYVALSRCTTLNGLVLHSPIHAHSISTDERVVAFARSAADTNALEQILEAEKQQYWASLLLKAFDWSKLSTTYHDWATEVPGKKIPQLAEAVALAKALSLKAIDQERTAGRFQQQLEQLLHSSDSNNLKERVHKAIGYFSKVIAEELLQPLQAHLEAIQYATRVKKYRTELKTLENFTWQQLLKLQSLRYGEQLIWLEENPYAGLDPAREKPKPVATTAAKTLKGSSKEESLALFQHGNGIAEIAALRNLATSTVASHLAEFIKTGEVAVTQLVAREKIEPILKLLDAEADRSLSAIREKLGNDYEFSEIRAVINHHQWLQLQKNMNTSI